MKAHETREMVRQRYAQRVQSTGSSCCGPTPTPAADELPVVSGGSCCCGPSQVDEIGRTLGYSDEELQALPEGANLGLGCGNPQAIAALRPGETVLDLGSGAGVDCFLAARQVGDSGRVIGVDMTPEMLARARHNAEQGSFRNVEFRLGEIEHLPVADQTVDVIISNCVINLSPEKPQVFREAFRVLKPGGRLAVSDMVTAIPLPPELQEDAALYAGCIAGAAPVAELQAMLADAGFEQIEIKPRDSRQLLESWGAGTTLADVLFSATIQAVRPR
ncbi:MAG: arsenite methyltransferase [Bacillota bacterium]